MSKPKEHNPAQHQAIQYLESIIMAADNIKNEMEKGAVTDNDAYHLLKNELPQIDNDMWELYDFVGASDEEEQ